MTYEFHPLADIFPLMEGEEFDALVTDIKKNGLREKMDLYQGKILDGRNRYRALLQLGIDPSADPKKYFRKAIYAHTIGGEIAPHEQSNDASVLAYIISKNIHRRHLTPEQKRAAIATLLKAQPEKSDRQIAKTAKVDHKTVGAARRQLEAGGEIPHLETRTDAKGVQQPATKCLGTKRSKKFKRGRPIPPSDLDHEALRAEMQALKLDTESGVEDPAKSTVRKYEENEEIRTAFILKANAVQKMAVYEGRATRQVYEAGRDAADAWTELADELEQRVKPKVARDAAQEAEIQATVNKYLPPGPPNPIANAWERANEFQRLEFVKNNQAEISAAIRKLQHG